MPERRDAKEAELSRLQRVKQSPPKGFASLGDEMLGFFKKSVQKRQTKLAHIAERWGVLVPDTLSAHCALEGLHRGTLTVIVDSSPHLYELKQLLLAGLEKQLLLACKSTGLRKITLKFGRWYDGDDEQERKLKFQER